MSTIIEIRLCDEDRARLDKIIEGLGNMRPNCASCAETVVLAMGENLKILQGHTEPAEDLPAQSEQHPVDAVTPHDDPEPAATVPEKVYTVTKADILAKVQALAAPNSPKREQAKAIVKSYGAKVSDIPEDKYDEVMAKLVELEG